MKKLNIQSLIQEYEYLRTSSLKKHPIVFTLIKSYVSFPRDTTKRGLSLCWSSIKKVVGRKYQCQI